MAWTNDITYLLQYSYSLLVIICLYSMYYAPCSKPLNAEILKHFVVLVMNRGGWLGGCCRAINRANRFQALPYATDHTLQVTITVYCYRWHLRPSHMPLYIYLPKMVICLKWYYLKETFHCCGLLFITARTVLWVLTK